MAAGPSFQLPATMDPWLTLSSTPLPPWPPGSPFHSEMDIAPPHRDAYSLAGRQQRTSPHLADVQMGNSTVTVRWRSRRLSWRPGRERMPTSIACSLVSWVGSLFYVIIHILLIKENEYFSEESYHSCR
ncbi:uncharacterized protein LOC123444213 isoform X9 [Hordeum vulgare subsp. vulgare]|uniref:Predicted protein n=1 Tax=Hordeum vulgare subsp. vulgare TaxID=112509 RepID=F2DGV2_HORVV|nr:uncharacterized protein LOC123444213 isoform X9 [Hordeum vulgare subsp. vulgare]BAJ94323.1 predicted protein [Hordeum vulgare subsp. vulgare]BAK02969.1 predicted protein [Hordeum vulgare subsp. vulgare]